MASVDEAVADGEAHELADGVQIELLHDAPAMRLHGVNTQAQRVGDFLVGLALGDHLQHFALAWREEVDGVGDVLAVVIEHGVTHLGAEVAFAVGHGAHGGEELGLVAVFEQVAVGPGTQHFAHIDGVLLHGECEDARLRHGLGNLPRGLDAVELRHGHVHDDDIGLEIDGFVHCLTAIGGFAHDFHIPLRGEDHAEAVAHHSVIVGEENAGLFGGHAGHINQRRESEKIKISSALWGGRTALVYAGRLSMPTLPRLFSLPLLLLVSVNGWGQNAGTAGFADVPAELGEIVIEGKAESLIGIATSAAKGQTSAKELMARPFSRRGELLESIPGFIATQHSGDGKANQYFLRGTNLDHGTDFAMYVDGMPVNFRNHAHGQGYADVNFIIPELVGELEYWKGTYYAQHGDLSSTGAARFKLLDALPQGILTTTWGKYQYTRTLAADTLQIGPGQLTVAVEHQFYNGPWETRSDAKRWNGFLRWHWEDGRDHINLTAMGYHGDWTATDQVANRAVGTSLGRFGTLDPTDGGNTQRYSLAFDWVRQGENATTRANAYAGYYDLDLFSNFTYFMDNPVRGDQFEQQDHRWFVGGQISRDWRFDALGHEQRFTVGFQAHTDFITGLGLYNTTARERWNTVRVDDITQSTWGLYTELEFKPTDWFRVVPGLRGDLFVFDVKHSTLPENAGSLSKGIVSPKLSMIFGPWAKTELYLNAGTGFHSNDARGVNIVTDPVTGTSAERVDPLVRTWGVEFGVRNESFRGLVNTLSVWMLHSDSELVYSGDSGTTEPGPASMRYGVELSSYWRPTEWAMVDMEATFTEAYLTTENPSSQNIPNSIPYTFNCGITLGGAQGFFGSLRARYFAPRPLHETIDIKARESFQVNARLGYRRANWEIALDCLNLLNRSDNDIAYYYESQLRTEAAPVSDVHLHPIEPRMFRLSVTLRF